MHVKNHVLQWGSAAGGPRIEPSKTLTTQEEQWQGIIEREKVARRKAPTRSFLAEWEETNVVNQDG